MQSKPQKGTQKSQNPVCKSYILLFLVVTFLCNSFSFSQNDITPPEGYTNDIGNMISMLDDLKKRIERSISGLDQEGTDFLLDDKANSPGAIIYHLAATEAYYQIYTLQNRTFNAAERKKWETALSLGDKARKEFKNKPMKYYLDIYDEVRKKTKELLKTKDDDWFNSRLMNMSVHWAWFHVMEHQANHMGQLALITKRIN